jgi:hypothetical protein
VWQISPANSKRVIRSGVARMRYGTSHLPLAVALDYLKKKDPFTGLSLAPVHRDLVIRVCFSPHDLMVIRDTISVCLFGYRVGAGDPNLRGHEIVQERCEEGTGQFFISIRMFLENIASCQIWNNFTAE